jgi:alpha-L-arabinofuranosidase
MFVVNAGLSHSDMTPLDRMSDRVKDALDAIEYANGATSTPMGAMRAANGHPAPFNLKYIEIGNENGYSWSFGGLPAYAERFDLINKGIKSKYPKIITISNVEVPNPGDYVSEHYYDTPNWFWNNKDRYDAYPRKGPKIYIGEYAVTRQNGRGALVGALSEAAFMTGMERNADIVAMGSYAPLFENVNRRQWNPNAIVFDSNRSYGTPSYWVQQLFGSHRIEIALTAKAQGPAVPAPPTEGRFGFKTWDTKAEFKDIKITVNGRVAYDVPAPSRDDLASTRGNWTIANGTMTQEALQTDRSVVLLPVAVKSSDDWTFEFSARTIEGKEGFIGLFGVTEDRFGHWNLGGWGNTQHGFERDGSRSGNGVNGKIETGKWYRVAISKKGAVISGQLDGKELATFREQPGSSRIAASLGLDGSRNELILKVVNGYATPQFVRLQGLPAAISDSWSGMKLTGPSATAENSLDDPTSVSPEPISVPAGNQIRVDANSLTILRIPVSALTVTQIKEAMNRKK